MPDFTDKRKNVIRDFVLVPVLMYSGNRILKVTKSLRTYSVDPPGGVPNQRKTWKCGAILLV